MNISVRSDEPQRTLPSCFAAWTPAWFSGPRRNEYLYLIATIFGYLPAPVAYVGVVQAALCEKLGANATLSNLPAAGYLLGSLGPVVAACMIPYRLERTAAVRAGAIASVLLLFPGLILVLPASNQVRVAAVILESLLFGIAASIQQLYLYQCLNRGTTPFGRARALKLTYSIGPLAAVAGSLAAQFVLTHGTSVFHYPIDFACLYFFGSICQVVTACTASGFKFVSLPEEPRPAFWRYIADTVRTYVQSRTLLYLGIAYALWYLALSCVPTMALYAGHVVGAEASRLVGLIMAVRFASKALGGYLQGALAQRSGIRAPLISGLTLMLVGVAWASLVRGNFYMVTFAFMGATELCGIYFPNYCMGASPLQSGARNLSLLGMAAIVASLGSAAHGALTDLVGFHASFALAGLCAVGALYLTLKLPAHPRSGRDAVTM